MQALIGHCASGSTNASLLASLLPAFVVVRNQPRLATFVGLLKEEAQADRAGKSFVLARMVELLFIEAIRSSGTLATPGLMRGLSDPRVAQAIRWSAASGPRQTLDGQRPWPPTARCLARRYLNALPT
ncbi:cupin domain-containing protein [Klebsiella pneumoniae subsp. pneumoniae]|nr:cupin domain-containing protein [Klebsiella pneumoniae subsp. pneumoniae]